MLETATILHEATARSLVIMDEIGRGTSTHDGLALAWACLKHLHDTVRCRTLFATHYHELAAMVAPLEGAQSCRAAVAVDEKTAQLLFLFKIELGAATRSYGIQVAQLAGLPNSVVQEAKRTLALLEAAEKTVVVKTL